MSDNDLMPQLKELFSAIVIALKAISNRIDELDKRIDMISPETASDS
jgi:hypothetical protein